MALYRYYKNKLKSCAGGALIADKLQKIMDHAY
jgi:hypothetical protein